MSLKTFVAGAVVGASSVLGLMNTLSEVRAVNCCCFLKTSESLSRNYPHFKFLFTRYDNVNSFGFHNYAPDIL